MPRCCLHLPGATESRALLVASEDDGGIIGRQLSSHISSIMQSLIMDVE